MRVEEKARRGLKGDPTNAIFKRSHIEIQDQTELEAPQPKIGQHLGVMNSCQAINRFQFENEFIFDEHIKAKCFSESQPFIDDWNFNLPRMDNPRQRKLMT